MGQDRSENVKLYLDQDPEEFHLRVYWSSKMYGYLLFTRHPQCGVLVGLDSKGAISNRGQLKFGRAERDLMGIA